MPFQATATKRARQKVAPSSIYTFIEDRIERDDDEQACKHGLGDRACA